MTREEAIEVIKQDIPCEHDTDLIEALDMAIKSLEQEPCEDAKKAKIEREYLFESLREDLKKAYEEIERLNKEQEPCEDAISREELLIDLYSRDYTKFTHRDFVALVQYQDSVYPKAKVGKWITWSEEIKCDGYTEYITHCKCSECDKEHDSYFSHFIKYCSNCGAKMEGVQE